MAGHQPKLGVPLEALPALRKAAQAAVDFNDTINRVAASMKVSRQDVIVQMESLRRVVEMTNHSVTLPKGNIDSTPAAYCTTCGFPLKLSGVMNKAGFLEWMHAA